MKINWSKVLSFTFHALLIAGGSYLSYTHGTPLPLVVTSGVNALLGSPLQAGSGVKP